MRKTAAIGAVVAFSAVLLGAGAASASDVGAQACGSSSHVSARLERFNCGNFIGGVRVTVTRSIGLVGHWEFRDSSGHIRNEPQSGDVWLAGSRDTTVEKFVAIGTRFCANLWENTGGGYALRGAPCFNIR
ncbi:hypothetical protein ABZX92_03450 [Lentzea sp. NPDC006480]|uniref:hypothetical protein n=1 Tax=Lentzea sp. NPDC006480 TaxID=3157176 RepID=UPI0033B2EF3F